MDERLQKVLAVIDGSKDREQVSAVLSIPVTPMLTKPQVPTCNSPVQALDHMIAHDPNFEAFADQVGFQIISSPRESKSLLSSFLDMLALEIDL